MNKINIKTIRVLAIESSCDETSASVIEAKLKIKNLKLKILSNVISSQVKLHARYGGVYPELASREHLKNILPVIEEALFETNSKFKFEIFNQIQNSNVSKLDHWNLNKNLKLKIKNSINAIAVTTGPGLIGSLLVGVNTAKTLAYALKKPIYAINHLEGHIYSAYGERNSKLETLNSKQIQNTNNLNSKLIHNSPKFPILALVVSGGHTSLVYMKNHFDYEVIGETLDDAAGEAFDKVAKLLGLGYPGGPAISQMANEISKSQTLNSKQIQNSNFQNPKKLKSQEANKLIKFPRPMIDSDNFDFSFSGLKTAVLYTWQKLKTQNEKRKTKSEILNLKSKICYEFQEAVVETLVSKTLRAAEKYGAKSIILCGGVSANSRLREEFELKIKNLKLKIDFFVPQKNLTSDNAAMIGIAAAYRLALGKKSTPWYNVNADPNLKLH